MNMSNSKKGLAYQSLPTVVLSVVLVGLMLGLGIYINSEVSTTISSPETVTNESVAFTANDTWAGLSFSPDSITSVQNTTDLIAAGAEQYTYRTNNGVGQVKLTVNATWNYTLTEAVTWNVTYQAWKDTEYFALQNATVGMGNLASWLPIMAVIIAAGMVIGVLVLHFGRREY